MSKGNGFCVLTLKEREGALIGDIEVFVSLKGSYIRLAIRAPGHYIERIKEGFDSRSGVEKTSSRLIKDLKTKKGG